MKPPDTVALLDWHAVGHHGTFFHALARALLEAGADVIALAPAATLGTPAFQGLLAGAGPRLSAAEITSRGSGRVWTSRAARRLQSLIRFHAVGRQVRSLADANGRMCGLLFFACIYDRDFEFFGDAARLLPGPWSGLYLQCRSFRRPGTIVPQTGDRPRPERIFRAARLRATAVLDEKATGWMQDLSGRPCIAFPDVTDTSRRTPPSTLGARMRRVAGPGPVIGALGQIQHTKGLHVLARAAREAPLAEAGFCVAGDAVWWTFPPAERREVEAFLSGHPRVFTHLMRLGDEADFNDLLAACDVVHAAYLDFPHSSNLLTKSALLRRPVVVSDGFLMAERVRAYRLGSVVPEGDAAALARALADLARDVPEWTRLNQPRWDDYARDHGPAALRDAMVRLLSATRPR